jgi:chromosome segregation ATPase
MKRSNRIWLIVLLGIVVILGVWLYFSLINSLSMARMELKESRAQAYKETKERQLLQEELKVTKEQLQRNTEELQKIITELENTQKELNIVNEKFSGAEKENQALIEEKNRLEAKLHSLKDLKEAIRQVKVEIHEQKVKRQREIDAEGLTGGNRGFLLKDGQSQYRPSIKIEVNPAN